MMHMTRICSIPDSTATQKSEKLSDADWRRSNWTKVQNWTWVSLDKYRYQAHLLDPQFRIQNWVVICFDIWLFFLVSWQHIYYLSVATAGALAAVPFHAAAWTWPRLLARLSAFVCVLVSVSVPWWQCVCVCPLYVIFNLLHHRRVRRNAKPNLSMTPLGNHVYVTAVSARVRNGRDLANKVFVKTARTHARAEIRGPLHEVVVPRGLGRGFDQQLTDSRSSRPPPTPRTPHKKPLMWLWNKRLSDLRMNMSFEYSWTRLGAIWWFKHCEDTRLREKTFLKKVKVT